jgi:hypothetical protein
LYGKHSTTDRNPSRYQPSSCTVSGTETQFFESFAFGSRWITLTDSRRSEQFGTKSVDSSAPEAKSELTQSVIEAEIKEEPIVSPAVTKTLAATLSESCLDKKISVGNIPASIAMSVQTKYGMTVGLPCYIDEKYIVTEVRTADGNLPISTLYFYNSTSQWAGYANPFQDIREYLALNNGINSYAIDIKDPGPYGISDLGVWVDVLGQKELSPDLLVRSVSFKIIKNAEVDELIKTYGTAYTSGANEDEPNYVVSSQQAPQFKTAFIKLAQEPGTQTNAEIIEAAESVDVDLNGINVK